MTLNQPQDNRKFTRVRFAALVSCNKIGENIESQLVNCNPPIIFDSMDISLGGLALSCKQPIPPGKVISIEVPIEQEKYHVLCVVMYCNPEDRDFRLGVEYVDPDKDFIKAVKTIVTKLSLMGQKLR